MTDSEVVELWNDLDDLRQSCHATMQEAMPSDKSEEPIVLAKALVVVLFALLCIFIALIPPGLLQDIVCPPGSAYCGF